MKVFSLKQIADIITSPTFAVGLDLEQWFKLILVLREAKLLAKLYHSAIKHDCLDKYPEYARKHLVSAFVHADRQQVQVIYESVTLVELLAEIHITPIFLKGANYILQNTTNSQGRIVSDIDILVEKKDLNKVECFLKTKLWRSEELSDYDDKYYRDWAHEIPPLYHLLRNTVLDIHHNLYLPISGRSLNISTFTHEVKKTEHGCMVLGNAATVLHSIIHLFMNEDFTNSFRDLLDIHTLINEFDCGSFWSELTTLSQDSGYEKELYYTLYLRKKVFDIDSSDLLTKLQPKYESFFSDLFINQILYHALTPNHPFLNTLHNRTAVFFMFLRGHWLKMPIHILAQHLVIKSYKGTIEKLLGKHFLDKD